MKFILRYLKRQWKFYLPGVVVLLATIGLDMLNPLLLRGVIDDVIKGGLRDLLPGLLAALLGVTIGRAIFGYGKDLLFDYASAGVAEDMRVDLFEHMSTLSASFFDAKNTGELMSRIKEDVDNIWRACGFCVLLLIQQAFYIVLPLVMLFMLSWKLTLLFLAVLPVILWLAMKLEKKLGKSYEKISDQAAKLNTTAQENIAGVRLIRSFAREGHEEEKFARENEHNYELGVEQTGIWASFFPQIEFFATIMTVLVITVGGILVIGDEMTVGTLVAINGYGNMLAWPMRELGWLTNIMSEAGASVKKLKELFEQKPEVVPPEAPEVPAPRGAVRFDNVSFSHGETAILRDVSIDIPAGSTVAIMGHTGAGKTTLANLLCRFYDCTAGGVTVDGVDVRNWDVHALRQSIAVVMQDVFLFSDTIRENILFGNDTDLGGDLPEVEAAARLADVEHFAERLTEGYDTVIGERGIGLSGGQKQRISIARALQKDCKILVLDDATSALDMETEAEIQTSVAARRGVTKIIIAHRISAARDADEIVILKDGQILERGTHRSLMAQKGYYYETYLEQYGAPASEAADAEGVNI